LLALTGLDDQISLLLRVGPGCRFRSSKLQDHTVKKVSDTMLESRMLFELVSSYLHLAFGVYKPFVLVKRSWVNLESVRGAFLAQALLAMAPKGQKRKSVGGDGDQTGRPLSRLPSSTAIGAAITTPLCTKIVEWFIGCIPVFVVLCLISAFWFNTCVEGGKPTSGHWVESTSTSWPSLQVRWVDKSLLSKFAVEVGSHDLPLFHKSFLTKASHMAWRLGFVNVESHVSSRFYLCFDPEA
jgi:hypothetical protein